MTSISTTNKVRAAEALKEMPSGIYLPPNAVRTSVRVAVEATKHTDEEVNELVDQFAYVQLRYPYIKPIFLISALEPSELTRAGFIYETVIPESTWVLLDSPSNYQDYKDRRFYEMIEVYQAQRMVSSEPGQAIPRWVYER